MNQDQKIIVNEEGMENISGGAAPGSKKTQNRGPRVQFVLKCLSCGYTEIVPGGVKGGDCPHCHKPLYMRDAIFPGKEAH